MKLIVAFIKPFKLEPVKDALKAAGITGMSVSDAAGFGRQSGQTEVYRGAEYEVDFIPKTRIDILLDDDLVEVAVDAIGSAAHTGDIGDGKVAILQVEDVLRIRTGERGRDAL